MWIAAVEGSRKMKPENPVIHVRTPWWARRTRTSRGDFFPPDFPVPWSWRPTCPTGLKSVVDDRGL